MMTKEDVHALARRWQIDTFTILREYVQVLFLYHLYGIKGSDRLFFKGGTAIRFLLGSFRFSEDLDFTSAHPSPETRKLLEEATRKLQRELPRVELGSFATKEKSLTARLRYVPEGASYPLTVHLEASLREKPLTRAVSPIETLYPISPYPVATHLAAEEIMAEKVRALIKRTKGRDLFDLWFLFSKGIRLDWKMVDKKMHFYGEKVGPEDLISKIEMASQETFSKDLAQFLPRQHRPLVGALKEKVLEKLKAGLGV